MGLRHAWKFIIDLFDFKNLDQALRDELPLATLKNAIPTYTAGILVALFSYFVLITLALLVGSFVYDALPEGYSTITVKPELTYGFFISSLIYFGLILFPYLVVGSFIYQGLAYGILMMFGGKGDFRKQYHLTSYIALALGIGTLGFILTFVFIIFLPCVNLFFLLLYLAATIYLVLYVQSKMLMAVHRTSFAAALIAIIITTTGSIIAFLVLNFLVGHFGLFPDFTTTFSIEGMGGNILDMPDIMGPAISGNITNATG